MKYALKHVFHTLISLKIRNIKWKMKKLRWKITCRCCWFSHWNWSNGAGISVCLGWCLLEYMIVFSTRIVQPSCIELFSSGLITLLAWYPLWQKLCQMESKSKLDNWSKLKSALQAMSYIWHYFPLQCLSNNLEESDPTAPKALAQLAFTGYR